MPWLRIASVLAVLPCACALPKGAPLHAPRLKPTAAQSGFPSNFTFGVASAAYQVEGAWDKDGRTPSIWDTFAHTPSKVKNNDTGDIAIDSYNRYMQDIDLAAELNMDFYRFSISWSRLLPNGALPANVKGVSYYNHLIDYALSKNITPLVTLYHWDLPQDLQDDFGGWLDRKIVDKFVQFAEVVFTRFGDRVSTFLSFNEPVTFLNLGYAEGVHAPGRCSNRTRCAAGNSSVEPYIAGHNVLLSHAYAAARYKELKLAHPELKQDGQLGMALNSDWAEPLTDSEADKNAAEKVMLFQAGWFADPCYFGDYPAAMKDILGDRLPIFTEFEKSLLKGSCDIYGLNYYTARYISAEKVGEQNPPSAVSTSTLQDLDVGSTVYDTDGNIIGPQSNSAWLYQAPWAFQKLLHWVSARYGNPPIYVMENGVSGAGDAPLPQGLNDSYRIEFYGAHMAYLMDSLENGVNVKAYTSWCLCDNFEWSNGYTERFGLCYVDRQHNLTRYKKDSAKWIAGFIDRPKHALNHTNSPFNTTNPFNTSASGGGGGMGAHTYVEVTQAPDVPAMHAEAHMHTHTGVSHTDDDATHVHSDDVRGSRDEMNTYQDRPHMRRVLEKAGGRGGRGVGSGGGAMDGGAGGVSAHARTETDEERESPRHIRGGRPH